jgi:hypothetical protein
MKFFISLLFTFFGLTINIKAQFDNVRVSTFPAEIFENSSFTIAAELLDGEQVAQAVLFYRSFGTTEFSSVDMIIQGNKLIAEIEGKNVFSPSVECYIKIINVNGVEKSYPDLATTTNNFIRIDVKKQLVTKTDLIILNPAPDEIMTRDEFFLAISFIRIPENVDKASTKIFVNDIDLSSMLQFSDDLSYIPQGSSVELLSGENNLKIFLYDKNGDKVGEYVQSFTVVTQQQKEELEKTKFALKGSAELNLADESLISSSTNYNRFNLQLNADYGSIFSNATVYVTNEEKSFLQPFNRFSFQAYNDWMSLNVGDHFPTYPTLILNGKRLRGFSFNLMLGSINIQTSYGEITRRVEGNLLSTVRRDTVVLDPNLVPIDSAKYGQPFGLVRFGTFSRKLFAVRPSFGSGENFQLGFTYLHSRDDEKSINFGAKPKENLVLGTDLFFGFDKRRIQLYFQSAFSLLNKDISSGNISDATLDSLAINNNLGIDTKLLKTIRDALGSFITVNQHLSPLNPHQLPTLAAEGNISINYFGNYFKAAYLYRGNQFSSFGQNFLKTDIKGFQLLDRISLFENRVFLSISLERLNDNLQKTKITTTTFNNYETSLSLYLRKDFPVVNFSFSNFDTKNDISPNTTDSIRLANILNDNVKVFNFSSSYDLDYYIKHRISLNYLNSSRRDLTYKNFSSSFNSFNISVQNIWNSELISFINSSISSSTIRNRDFNYYSFTVGGRMSILDGKMNNSAALTIYSGSLKRNMLDISSRYLFFNNLSAIMNIRYILNPSGTKNESMVNFLVRYEF